MKQRVVKVISGGQTGADRAALDAAIHAGVDYGGWLPRGRKTEDGPLSLSYRLKELESGDYRDRTARNVCDADGTLIISHGELTGGSLLTKVYAQKYGQPWLHIDCCERSADEAIAVCGNWLHQHRIAVLNVAGPRASGDPAIYEVVRMLVGELLLRHG